MSNITKDDVLKLTVDLVSSAATKIANEEIIQFEKDNPSELITDEIRLTVIQRAVSELMFRTSNFKLVDEPEDESSFTAQFNNWFNEGEEQKLRLVCRSNTKEQIEKHRAPNEGEMSFIDRYLRQVREDRDRLSNK